MSTEGHMNTRQVCWPAVPGWEKWEGASKKVPESSRMFQRVPESSREFQSAPGNRTSKDKTSRLERTQKLPRPEGERMPRAGGDPEPVFLPWPLCREQTDQPGGTTQELTCPTRSQPETQTAETPRMSPDPAVTSSPPRKPSAPCVSRRPGGRSSPWFPGQLHRKGTDAPVGGRNAPPHVPRSPGGRR